MADDQRESGAATGRPEVLAEVCGAIQHILMNVDRSRSDIVSDILDDIDEIEIIEAREKLFDIAKGVLKSRSGVTPDIEAKKRKGNNCLVNSACDLYDLYMYICNEEASFPKDLVSIKQSNVNSTKLIDIENPQQHPNVNNDFDDMLALPSDKLEEKIVFLIQTCKDQCHQIRSLSDDLTYERQTRQTEMTYWVNKVQMLIEGMQKRGYVCVEESGEIPNVILNLMKHRLNVVQVCLAEIRKIVLSMCKKTRICPHIL